MSLSCSAVCKSAFLPKDVLGQQAVCSPSMEPKCGHANSSQTFLPIPWLSKSLRGAAFAALFSSLIEALHYGIGNAEYRQLPDVLTTFCMFRAAAASASARRRAGFDKCALHAHLASCLVRTFLQVSGDLSKQGQNSRLAECSA